MTEQVVATPGKIKHKSFTYRTSLVWSGARAGVLGSEDKPPIQASSPPEFKGVAGAWTPEDLFVGAVNMCTLMTFVAFAERLGVPFLSYSSEAEGTLEFVDGSYRFTRVTVRPLIRVTDGGAAAAVERALHEAHDSCIVSNSIRPEVVLEPTIELSQP